MTTRIRREGPKVVSETAKQNSHCHIACWRRTARGFRRRKPPWEGLAAQLRLLRLVDITIQNVLTFPPQSIMLTLAPS